MITKSNIRYTGADLLTAVFPPIRYAVPGIIPEGLTFFAAKPKMGKSMFALSTCRAIVTGGKALTNIQVSPGAALYISYEDGPRRHQDRLRRMLRTGVVEGMEDLHTYYEWPRMGSGGLRQIGDVANTLDNLKFVVIDTFQIFRPKSPTGKYSYADDYGDVYAVKVAIERLGLSCLVLHHLRKAEAEDIMDTLNGSMGISGGVDSILALERKSSHDPKAVLHTTGRDIESAKYDLIFHPKTFEWEYVGKVGATGSTECQTKILTVLKATSKTLTPKQITDATGENHEKVKKTLQRMASGGMVTSPAYGQYSAPL